MHKVTVSRMRERHAQTVLTFRITYVIVFNSKQNMLAINGEQQQDSDSILNHGQHNTAIT